MVIYFCSGHILLLALKFDTLAKMSLHFKNNNNNYKWQRHRMTTINLTFIVARLPRMILLLPHFTTFHFSTFRFFFLNFLFVLSSVVIVKIVQWNNNIDNNALFNAQIKGCHLSNYLIFYLCTEIRRKNTHSWIGEKG